MSLDVQKLTLGDLYIVKLLFEKATPTHELHQRQREHIIRRADLDALVTAYKTLHYDPGINNGAKCSVIWEIKAAPFRSDGPYWWTSPTLDTRNGDGVPLIEYNGLEEVVVWQHPDYIAKLQSEMEAEND